MNTNNTTTACFSRLRNAGSEWDLSPRDDIKQRNANSERKFSLQIHTCLVRKNR